MSHYADYLNSDDWKRRVRDARLRAGWRCQTCNVEQSDDVILEVHHRTYERLGCERPEDLIVLCPACHRLVTARQHQPLVMDWAARAILLLRKWGRTWQDNRIRRKHSNNVNAASRVKWKRWSWYDAVNVSSFNLLLRQSHRQTPPTNSAR